MVIRFIRIFMVIRSKFMFNTTMKHRCQQVRCMLCILKILFHSLKTRNLEKGIILYLLLTSFLITSSHIKIMISTIILFKDRSYSCYLLSTNETTPQKRKEHIAFPARFVNFSHLNIRRYVRNYYPLVTE